MRVRYKRNRSACCYESQLLETVIRDPPPKPAGPFPDCGSCPYPGHGFLCWGNDRCIRKDMRGISERFVITCGAAISVGSAGKSTGGQK